MKIAFYHCSLPEPGRKPGGVAVFVDRLAVALAQAGHDITVFTYSRHLERRPYTVRVLRPTRARTSAFMRQYVASWLFNIRPFGQDFDVVHLHGDDWFYWRRTVPTIRTFYGSAVFEAATATSWKRKVNSSVIFGLELAAARRADAVYGIGVDSRALFSADGVLGFGISATTERLVATATATPPAILFVGAWEGRKRGGMLRDLFLASVRPRVPDAELWMVSDYAEEGSGVRWFKHPDDAGLAALYRKATVFCLPSTYEGLGIPYIEAMGHGLPVVATPNLGAVEVLGGGRFGLVVEDRDLGESLASVLTDRPLRERLVKASNERAEYFNWSRVLHDYEEAYALAIDRFHATQRRG